MKNQKQTILDILEKSGIENASFCAFLPLLPYLIPCRNKNKIPENAKTVIPCFFPYKVKETPPKNISRYAAIPDYHIILGERLEKATENLKKYYVNYNFVWFTDNSPIPEVYAAALSGLGVIGDNGLLITKEYGSFVFLGEILTDLEIETSGEIKECLHCGKCKSVCPKKDGIDCLSSVTQKKKPLETAEIKAIKEYNTVWGCDICQEVCPMNKEKKLTDINEFILGYKNEYELSENPINRPYNWRGEEIIKRNFKLL